MAKRKDKKENLPVPADEQKGQVFLTPLEEVLPGSMLPYAEYVILDRALPRVEDVLAAPEEAPVPAEPAALYAVSEALASRASWKNLPAVFAYLERLPVEFGVLCMRQAVCRDGGLVESPAFGAWAQKHADVLL